jgi:hypothetical protein
MADSFESLSHTVSRVVDDVRELFREEVALARAEIRQEVSGYTTAAIQLTIGAAAGLLAAIFLLHAVALGLATLTGWNVWITYLATALLAGAVSAAAIVLGMNRAKRTPAVPPRTMETLQENKEWLKHRMSSERR